MAAASDWRRIAEGAALVAKCVAADSRLAARLAAVSAPRATAAAATTAAAAAPALPPRPRGPPPSAPAPVPDAGPSLRVALEFWVDRGSGAARSPSPPPPTPPSPRPGRAARVPSSALGRALGFASLGASLVAGAAAERVTAALGGGGDGGGAVSEANAERLAAALCRMRGAALKLGQMLSIADDAMLPGPLATALARARAAADVMPPAQLEAVLAAELGPAWRARFASFDDAPIAAASIGQVHAASLLAPWGGASDGGDVAATAATAAADDDDDDDDDDDAPGFTRVAVKVQYPGVADSIVADVDNLLRVAAVTGALPRGLFVEAAASVAKAELTLECDYLREAAAADTWRAHLASDTTGLPSAVRAPRVVHSLTTRRVLVTEFCEGGPIDAAASAPQAVRDALGATLLRLTLRELFEWRFMQTDPNWGNFLFDPASGILTCIDFGACRSFGAPFVDRYLAMVRACAAKDDDAVLAHSRALGFLTGDESPAMNAAHVAAARAVGDPFADAAGVYDFGAARALTAAVSEQGRIMLAHRLTPPPEEAYSLHRRLSGAFLACIKLGARVPAGALLQEQVALTEARKEREAHAAAGGG